MGTISRYWNLVRLDSSGKVQTTEISSAKHFMLQQFADELRGETIADSLIQKHLVDILPPSERLVSLRCLRCFISQQIKQTCLQLEFQFGREHGFSRHDLYLYVLDDTLDNFRDRPGRKPAAAYQTLAEKILATFEPSKANLTTWTNRYVRQHPELQRFLLSQGIYLISNWAILNDTNRKQLSRILGEFHQLSPTEIAQAQVLLTGYHQVYRSDRLKNRQGKGGKCSTPTSEQLKRIAHQMQQQSEQPYSGIQILEQLESLAFLLREYRIHVRGGQVRQRSLDDQNLNVQAIEAAVPQVENQHQDWLQAYQDKFQQSLEQAIAQVVTQRLQKFRGKKAGQAPKFVKALQLFHCEGRSMGEIAPEVELKAQYQVTRLLKLKELRADIRQTLLQSLQDWATGQVQSDELAVLKEREQAIASALEERVDTVLDEAAKEVSVAHRQQSLLAQQICAYLDQDQLNPQQPSNQ